MADLTAHWRYLQAEWQSAQAAPLSTRKALLVAMLMDAFVDRLFACQIQEQDILVFRQQLAERSPELGLIMALAGQREGVNLALQSVVVPLQDYGRLSVEDFMVSLYNDHSVQRLRIGAAVGSSVDGQETLGLAMMALGAAAGPEQTAG